MLVLTSFGKALDSLKEALKEYQKDISNTFVRDSVIQRFEYTYELSIKMLKRYLEMTASSNDEIDLMSFNDIIRKGNVKGLLNSNLEEWNEYREMRNITSHTYKEEKAIKVVGIVDKFLYDAEFLLNTLKSKC
ncbi:MAG TPA: nucleotidyltransferase substrate binding protein [Rickettsiales bacterium]|nr:nucleotidyltransferase substrate binding protein [Rickettsiales bacterium]